MPTIICPHCGVSNREGSNFCNNCGTALRLPDDAPRRSTSRTESDVVASDDASSASEPDVTDRSATPAESTPSHLEAPYQQPWLAPVEDEEEDEPGDTAGAPAPADDAEAATTPTPNAEPPRERLLTGVQGLLEPHAIAMPSASAPLRGVPQAAPGIGPSSATPLSAAEWRHLRQILTEEPQVAQPVQPPKPGQSVSLRLPWLFLLLGIGLTLPILLRIPAPGGAPHIWPGVRAAHTAIQTAPDSRDVLVFWAYDPATAGEMDRVAQPVITHLLARDHRLRLASPLPGGIAVARRLLAQIQSEGELRFFAPPRAIGYLPGGAAVLPLLAQDGTFLSDSAPMADTGAQAVPADFAVVVAARAEFVQHYLEQVQPLNRLPVIAVTSAAADPVLRPYWNSGQLQGLVSGFDGGSAYWLLLDEAATRSEIDESDMALTQAGRLRLRQQMVLQNWGHILFLLIILGGNVAYFLNREG